MTKQELWEFGFNIPNKPTDWKPAKCSLCGAEHDERNMICFQRSLSILNSFRIYWTGIKKRILL